MPFLGTTPTQGFVGANPKQSFTANGSTTVFTLTNPVASANDLEVFVGNVRQEPTAAYSAAGTTLTMTEAPDTGLNFYVINKSQAQVTTTPPVNSISTDKILDNAVTAAKIPNSAISLSGSKVTGTLPVANGGTALTSGFLNGGITFGAATSVGGSNSTTFTGIPSTATMIRVLWHGLTPGNQYPEWRLGNSSAIITAGYFNHQHYDNHGANSYSTYTNNGNSFRLDGWSNVNNTWYGWWDFVKQPHTNGNTYWHQTSHIWNSGFTTYGGFNVRGFVNATTTTVDRYQIIGASSANITEGNIQVGYI